MYFRPQTRFCWNMFYAFELQKSMKMFSMADVFFYLVTFLKIMTETLGDNDDVSFLAVTCFLLAAATFRNSRRYMQGRMEHGIRNCCSWRV